MWNVLWNGTGSDDSIRVNIPWNRMYINRGATSMQHRFQVKPPETDFWNGNSFSGRGLRDWRWVIINLREIEGGEGGEVSGRGGKEEGKGERKKKNESTPLGEHPVSYINWYVLFLHIHRLVSTDTSLRPHHSDHAPTMPNHRHRQVTGESSPVNWI